MREKRANGIAQTFRSLREWESNRVDFAPGFSFFFPFSLSIHDLLSALGQGCAVVRVDNRAMPTCARDCPTAKETGQMSGAPRGDACTRFAKLLINAHDKTFLFPILPLFLSLSLSFSASFRALRDHTAAHVKASWPVRCNTRERPGSFSHDVIFLRWSFSDSYLLIKIATEFHGDHCVARIRRTMHSKKYFVLVLKSFKKFSTLSHIPVMLEIIV